MKRRKTVYEYLGRECGDGWNGLVEPLCDEVLRRGGTIRQIKQKFGRLTFIYSLPKSLSERARRAFRRQVDEAEAASLGICEDCGKPGELINDEGLFLTACEACHEAWRERSRWK